jgi:hypothetical protein
METKDKFIGLLRKTRKLIKDPQTVKKWDKLIKMFEKETPEQLQEHFHYNNIYQLDFMLENELENFNLVKMPILEKHMKNKSLQNKLREIDESLTIQLSNILPKIYIAEQLIKTPDSDMSRHINSLHRYIEERNNVNCLLKWVLEYY